MVEKKVVITNATGLHARPASDLTKYCQKIEADVKILAGTNVVDPKSIISVLSAGIKHGTEITIQVEGPDEAKVCDDLAAFLQNLKG